MGQTWASSRERPKKVQKWAKPDIFKITSSAKRRISWRRDNSRARHWPVVPNSNQLKPTRGSPRCSGTPGPAGGLAPPILYVFEASPFTANIFAPLLRSYHSRRHLDSVRRVVDWILSFPQPAMRCRGSPHKPPAPPCLTSPIHSVSSAKQRSGKGGDILPRDNFTTKSSAPSISPHASFTAALQLPGATSSTHLATFWEAESSTSSAGLISSHVMCSSQRSIPLQHSLLVTGFLPDTLTADHLGWQPVVNELHT